MEPADTVLLRHPLPGHHHDRLSLHLHLLDFPRLQHLNRLLLHPHRLHLERLGGRTFSAARAHLPADSALLLLVRNDHQSVPVRTLPGQKGRKRERNRDHDRRAERPAEQSASRARSVGFIRQRFQHQSAGQLFVYKHLCGRGAGLDAVRLPRLHDLQLIAYALGRVRAQGELNEIFAFS